MPLVVATPLESIEELDAAFEDGRLLRTFGELSPLGASPADGFQAQQNFEAKCYKLKRIALKRRAGGPLRYARLIAHLALLTHASHPGLARYVGFWAERSQDSLASPQEGFIYLQIERPSELTLAAWLEGCRPTLADTFLVFSQLLAAVAYLHGLGITGANLAPEKVLVCDEGAKLQDFGLPVSAARDESELQACAFEERLQAQALPSVEDDLRALGALLQLLLARTERPRVSAGRAPEDALAQQLFASESSGATAASLLKGGAYLAWQGRVFDSLARDGAP